MLSICRMAAVGLLCAVLAACGGGGGSDNTGGSGGTGGGGGNGGGGGGGTPSGPVAPVPNAYLPTDTSLQFTYNTMAAASLFEATVNRNDVFVAPYRYPTGGKEYYVSTPEGVSFAGFYSPQLIVGGVGTFTADARFSTPVTLFRNDWTTQQGTAVSGTGTVTITPTYNDQPLTYAGTATYVGTEDVTTPLGTFSAKHVRLDINVTAAVQGSVFNVPYRVELWFARNVGIVRRSEQSQVFALQQITGPDADGDKVFDGLDAFPGNVAEARDFDGDGIGDNADPDDDSDGVADVNDKFPFDKKESLDSDNDGVGDVADLDDDNDGLGDNVDPFPYDMHNEDTDHDGIADFYDTDDDNDGILDAVDRFPLNPLESVDTDNDSIGNNADTDDDNDGRYDLADDYPLNANRWQKLDVDVTTRSLDAVFGSAVSPFAWFNVIGENVQWEAVSSVPWLHLTNTFGHGPQPLGIETDSTGLALGTHTGRVTLRDPETGRSVGLDVQMVVSLPQLTATASMVSFDGKYGWDTVTKPVDVMLNTGINTYPVTVDVSFDSPDAITGTVVGGRVGGLVNNWTSARLNVDLDPSKLHGGRHTGKMKLTANVLGQPVSYTIDLEALATTRVLYPSSEAVALGSISNKSSTTRRIRILDSYGIVGTAWTATTSGESWLQSVTASGLSGGEMTITTIDPSLLGNGLYRATITLSSPDATFDKIIPIQVSMYRQNAPGPIYMTVAAAYEQIVSDPLRPYVYLHNGGNVIDVYNMYLGTQAGTINGITGTPGEMATSSDGKWLFVQDAASGGVTRINLETQAVDATWPLTEMSNSFPKNAIAYARPNGHPILLLSDRRYVDADTGAVLGEADIPNLLSLDLLAGSFDGRIVCAVTRITTPYSGDCIEPKYGDIGTPGVFTARNAHISGHDAGGGFATDVAITADGQAAFVTIDGGSWAMYGTPLSPVGHGGTIVTLNQYTETGRGVATALDGGLYMNQYTSTGTTEWLRGWNDNGDSLRIPYAIDTTKTVEALRGQLVASGDTIGIAFLVGTPSSPTVSTQLRFVRW